MVTKGLDFSSIISNRERIDGIWNDGKMLKELEELSISSFSFIKDFFSYEGNGYDCIKARECCRRVIFKKISVI